MTLIPLFEKCRPLRGTNARRGFTLVELLVVIAIIGILAGIVISVQRGVYTQQSRARAQADLAALGTALESYKARWGDYPRGGDSQVVVEALTGTREPDGTSISNGKVFIQLDNFNVDSQSNPTRINDPWGNEYQYRYKTGGGSSWATPGFLLWSHGSDGKSTNDLTGNNTGIIDPADLEKSDNVDNIIFGRTN